MEPHQKLVYSGNGTEYAILMFKNLALTILTLGIYGAWARTENRRYVWGNVSYLGDRTTYTGTGKELFKGWLRVIGVYIAFYVAATLLSIVSPFLAGILIPIYVYLYALVVYGGTRYRLSRTKWREVNFGMDRDKHSTRRFIWLVFKGAALAVLTLGIYIPFQINHIRKFLTNKSRFGNIYFTYGGEGSELFLIYLKGFFLVMITLGIYLPWFMCSLLKYRLKHTKLENIEFDLDLDGGDLLLAGIASYLLAFITLGIATPWLINWFHKIFINAIVVKGQLDLTMIYNQPADAQDATADVAAIEYDIDLGF